MEELEEIARKMTSEALKKYSIPDDLGNNLTLGVIFDGDYREFILYVPGERPEDALDIARTRINSLTGEGKVEVLLPKRVE